jgi:hypothetical protein
MKKTAMLLALLCLPVNVYAMSRGGGPVLPSGCASAPTPPAQATSAGLTIPTLCDSFSTNVNVDVNNTQAAGYDWYPAPVNVTRPITPSGNNLNDGTGIQLTGSGTNGTGSNGQVIQTLGRSANTQKYVGPPTVGSFYAEVDMKYDPTTPAGQTGGNSPAFWLASNKKSVDSTVEVPAGLPADFPYLELDIFEFFPEGMGSPGQPRMNGLEWLYNSGTPVTSCNMTATPSLATLGNPTFTNYNTYGMLFLASTDNGGTGSIKWYFNNNLIQSCTYSAAGTPSCTPTTASSCSTGAWMEMDTQPHSFIIGTGYPTWVNTVRNFHVWRLH